MALEGWELGQLVISLNLRKKVKTASSILNRMVMPM